MRILPRVALSVLTVLLMPSGGVWAHGGGQADGGSRPSAVASPPSKGLTASWNALLAARDGIAADLDAGRLDGIHEKAGTVPDFARTLLGQADDLSASQQARLKSGVTQISKVAEHLHGATGAGPANLEVLRGDLKRMDRALRLILAQYPEGSLAHVAQSAVLSNGGGH